MAYTVGEVAKKLNVAASTLRYYDKEGLFPFVERSAGGIRIFRDEDFAWLEIIDCLKRTGMPIKDIKHFIDYCMEGDSAIDERLSIIKSQRDAVIGQMQEMQEMLDILNFKTWYYETAKAKGTCELQNIMNVEDVPEQYRKFVSKAK